MYEGEILPLGKKRNYCICHKNNHKNVTRNVLTAPNHSLIKDKRIKNTVLKHEYILNPHVYLILQYSTYSVWNVKLQNKYRSF